MIDLDRLRAIPDAAVPRTDVVTEGIAASVTYLASDAALRSVEVDPYWPKWDSPWWHVLLLHELGETARIPRRITDALAAGIDGLLHVMPIEPTELVGIDPHRDLACHCALGTMVPILAACGVPVDRALPWVKPWFARYQMTDGGLNCDETAYRVTSGCASSMVATVPALEAMLALGADDRGFVDRAARCVLDRGLERGSSSVHNAEEREAAPAWHQLAFPRFYFYDVLRGLSAVTAWAEVTAQPLAAHAIAPVVSSLCARFPDGIVRVERHAHAGRQTYLPTADRSPSPRAPATSFALLDAVSAIGAPSEALTREWAVARARLRRITLVA
jgi:hypothetical protein